MKNFQIHEYDEVLSMWGPDVAHVPPRKALFQFSLAVSAFVAFGFLCNYALVPDRPTVPREYPYSGLVRELGGLEENKVRFSIDSDPGYILIVLQRQGNRRMPMTRYILHHVYLNSMWRSLLTYGEWNRPSTGYLSSE